MNLSNLLPVSILFWRICSIKIWGMAKVISVYRNFADSTGFVWPIILVPIWQEYLFRFLPYRLLYLPSGKFWLIGVMTSLLFALIHFYFKPWFIVFTFFAGMFAWYLLVKYGFLAAVLFHALLNLIAWVFKLKELILK